MHVWYLGLMTSDKNEEMLRGLTLEEINVLGQAILAEVFEFSIPKIRKLAGAAGLDASQIPAKSEESGGHGSHAEVRPAVQKLFGGLTPVRKVNALFILADRLITERVGDERVRAKERLSKLLGQHGFQYVNGSFLPVGLIDERESRFLPETSYAHLAAAFRELVSGDESSAITKACGAVDALTQALYHKNGWGDPPTSFQTKVNTSLQRLNVFPTMKVELKQLDNMKPTDAEKIVDEMSEATKRAAEALQVIRRTMGDVHGTKPALKKTAYDAIKWASAICGLLEGYL